GFPDVAEISGRHVDERREAAEAGVVDEGVVAAELADDGRDKARDIGFTAHIGFDGRGADFFRGSAERGDMASADRHTRAGRGEAFGGGIADAGTAAGDEYSGGREIHGWSGLWGECARRRWSRCGFSETIMARLRFRERTPGDAGTPHAIVCRRP